MLTPSDREFGRFITRLIQKDNLTRREAHSAFRSILKDGTTEMQQGAFLAALTAKGETVDEVAGCWEAIYALDTRKVNLDPLSPLVENSGTGMDSFKTFNISTAASIVAAAGGVRMARHGARAITSVCGTVDIAEALGVDVDCSTEIVAESIVRTGIGLFNGMSPRVHPCALGRILSKISFGSTLNIAASLANPALPRLAVRGVYRKEMVPTVAKVMRAIGYKRALVLYGTIDDTAKGMDEGSVCGATHCAELGEKGAINEFTFRPSDFGLQTHAASELVPQITRGEEARSFVALIQDRQNGARRDAVLLNAGLVFYVAGLAGTIGKGITRAAETLSGGKAFDTLEKWVIAQNRNPQAGLEKLRSWIA